MALTPDTEITEKQFDADLFATKNGLAPSLGWSLNYHVLRSKESQAGFPDRVIVRERVIFVETKSEKAKPTDEQIRWLDGLARAGAECYLWRPSDIDEIARVLQHRWLYSAPVAGPESAPPTLTRMGALWTPKSIWVPGTGRADALGT